MKREEIDLYEDNERALTKALVKGLEQASRLHPIVLAIDTYEQIDEGADIDDWMRNVFLKEIINTAPKVSVIIAGRKNHFPEYRNSLPSWALYSRNFDDILFTDKEILDLAKRYELEITSNDALLIRAATAGIPLVVNDILLLLKDGKNKQEVLQDLDKHAGTVDQIIHKMVERFLKYTDKEEWKLDRYRCYQMAMLREFDPELLRESWQLSTEEFVKTTKELSKKHSFIDNHSYRLHDKVKEFLRKYLISQYRLNTAERLQIQELATPMLEATKKRLDSLIISLPNKKDRYADNRFVGNLFDLLLCQIWADSGKLISIIPDYLIDLLVFAPEIAKSFTLELEELAPLFPTSQLAIIKIIYQGIHTYEPLTFESSSRLPLPAESKLFEYLKQKIKWKDKVQQALFDFQYGNHLIRLTDYDNAFICLDRSVPLIKEELSSELNISFFRLAYALPELSFEKKEKNYTISIKLNPKDAIAYNNRGNLYSNYDDKEKSLADYNKSLELNPEYAIAYNNRGFLYYKNYNDKEKSLLDYNKAIELNPEYVLAYNNRGFLYYKNYNDKERALSDYNKAIELNPEDADAYNNRGILYKNGYEDKENALSDYSKAIDLNPAYALAYINRGNLYKNNYEDKENALSDYTKAIELNPEYALAYNNRGDLYAAGKQYEKAIEDYNKAIKYDEHNDDIWHSIGWCYLLLKNLEESELHLLKAWKLSDYKHGGAPMNLGHIQLLKENKEQAIEWYQKSIPLWEDKKDFFDGMEEDFLVLNMESYGITKASYDVMLV